MKTCFFCHQPIEGKAEKHHRTPRRYFRKGEGHRRGNTFNCHPSCHRRFHFEYDNPKLSLQGFLRVFEPLNFGDGLFTGD